MNTWPRFFTLKRVVLILASVVVVGLGLGEFGMFSPKPSNQSVRPTLRILKDVQIGVKNYEIEYNRWPVSENEEDYFAVLRGGLVRCLAGEASDLNPRGIRFIDLPMTQPKVRSGGLMRDNTEEIWIVDQWSRPIYVVIDADHDNSVRPPDIRWWESRDIPIGVAVFSAGPDGIPGNEDDVTSWRG